MTAVRTARGWLTGHDPGLVALRKALRVTVAACVGFFVCEYLIGLSTLATYAVFGTIAFGVLSDVSGPPAQRTRTYLAALPVALVLVTIGTAAARSTPAAVVGMLVVGFAVAYAGVGGPRIAGVANGLQLFYVLPCFPPYDPASLPQRLIGLTIGIGLVAAADRLLWPAGAPVPFRARLADAVDAVARYVANLPADDPRGAAEAAVNGLRSSGLPPAVRPTGPGRRDRGLTHATAELRTMVVRAHLLAGLLPDLRDPAARAAVDTVLALVGDALAHCAAALRGAGPPPESGPLVDRRRGLPRGPRRADRGPAQRRRAAAGRADRWAHRRGGRRRTRAGRGGASGHRRSPDPTARRARVGLVPRLVDRPAVVAKARRPLHPALGVLPERRPARARSGRRPARRRPARPLPRVLGAAGHAEPHAHLARRERARPRARVPRHPRRRAGRRGRARPRRRRHDRLRRRPADRDGRHVRRRAPARARRGPVRVHRRRLGAVRPTGADHVAGGRGAPHRRRRRRPRRRAHRRRGVATRRGGRGPPFGRRLSPVHRRRAGRDGPWAHRRPVARSRTASDAAGSRASGHRAVRHHLRPVPQRARPRPPRARLAGGARASCSGRRRTPRCCATATRPRARCRGPPCPGGSSRRPRTSPAPSARRPRRLQAGTPIPRTGTWPIASTPTRRAPGSPTTRTPPCASSTRGAGCTAWPPTSTRAERAAAGRSR